MTTNFTPAQLRRIADILESNDDQPGFDFASAVAAMEAEDVDRVSRLITVKGIRVSEDGYNAAPEPKFCHGTDDGSNCLDDAQDPCKACFLYDEELGESRYWWDDDVVLYTIYDANNSYHEAGLTERQLRSRLRRLGYGFNEGWEIAEIIYKLTEDGDELGIESTED